MNTLQTRAIEAVARFCDRKGYEILSTNWESPFGINADIVACDDGTICFIDVTVVTQKENGFSDNHIDRRSWELVAASWLTEHARENDFSIRFDYGDLIVLNNDKAFLRYRTNALSEG